MPDQPEFKIGDKVVVVNPRASLRAKIGEEATVVGFYHGSGYLDLKWDRPGRQCKTGCYASQFGEDRGNGPQQPCFRTR